MAATINVKAAPGRAFPMERRVRKYITDQPVTVESSAYYRRAIQDGDLVLVTESEQSNEGQADASGTEPAVAVQVKGNKKGASNE